MINSVYSTSSEWMQANYSGGSMPYINPTQPMTGMVRYNNNQLQVYDGSSWLSMGGGTASVGLTPRTEEVLKWAEQQMKREQLIKSQLNNPTVADAWRRVQEAQEQLNVVMELVKIHE